MFQDCMLQEVGYTFVKTVWNVHMMFFLLETCVVRLSVPWLGLQYFWLWQYKHFQQDIEIAIPYWYRVLNKENGERKLFLGMKNVELSYIFVASLMLKRVSTVKSLCLSVMIAHGCIYRHLWMNTRSVVRVYCNWFRCIKLIFMQVHWNLCNQTPEFSNILWHPTKIYCPIVFLLTKIKPEYSDILYNPTHFPGPLVCRIRQVPLYMQNIYL